MYGDDKKEAFIKEYLRSKVIIETSLYAIFKKVKPFEREMVYCQYQTKKGET